MQRSRRGPWSSGCTAPTISRSLTIAELTAPVISYLQFHIKGSEVEPFEQSLKRLLEEARAAEGCLWAYAFRGQDVEPSYMVLSGWEDAAKMRVWEDSPRHQRAVRTGQQEYFSRPMVVRRYNPFQ